MNQILNLEQPNSRVRLGRRKWLRIQRKKDLIEGVAWVSFIFLVSAFLIEGGLKDVFNFADLSDPANISQPLKAINRLSALIATNLLLIHMLLIARVPWIDRNFGHDKATNAHRRLGKPIFYLLVLHVVTTVVGYSISEGTTLWDQVVYLITEVDDLLTATIAFVLMALVVVTSIRIARRKLSYEAWYLVHLLSYAAVLLAIPHQLELGSDIAEKPIQTAYWVGLYVFVAANILLYRFGLPIFKALRHQVRVRAVIPEGNDSVSVYLTGNQLEKLGTKSGQFYLLRFLTGKQWWRPHPFSVSVAPNSSYLRFTIGNRGDDTALIQRMKSGTKVLLEGPYGVFTEDRRTREKVTLIAAGIGVAPIRSLAASLASRPGDITVIYRVRDANEAALVSELREISERRGHTLHVLEGPRGRGDSWLPEDLQNTSDAARLRKLAPDIANSDIFICGPSVWTRQVTKSLTRLGVGGDQIHAEEFAW